MIVRDGAIAVEPGVTRAPPSILEINGKRVLRVYTGLTTDCLLVENWQELCNSRLLRANHLHHSKARP